MRHPDENQAAEDTLLGLAAGALAESAKRWADHHDEVRVDGETLVEPILVVQVKPGIKAGEVGEIGVAVVRLLVQVFAWAESNDGDDGLPPSAVA